METFIIIKINPLHNDTETATISSQFNNIIHF